VSCSSLQSICLPASVETIRLRCFEGCKNLSSLTFEPGSRLSRLGDWAFADCRSFQSICIPSSIETISPSCFRNWPKNADVVLEPGCRLSAESVSELRSRFHVTLK
jgi:hypothetical protein